MSSGFRPVFTTTHPITGGLARIERARGLLEAALLSEHWLGEMGQRALLLEAHHTTYIEGTRLTLDQSRQLLEGSPVADADPEDARELLNYRKAFDFVSDQDFERLCPDVNRRSLQRDIRAMIEQGIVEEEATSPTDPGKRYVFNEG